VDEAGQCGPGVLPGQLHESAEVRGMSEDIRAHQASMQRDGADLTAAIMTRRRRKCIAEGCHIDGACGRCGL
jgi:hypothetical protein